MTENNMSLYKRQMLVGRASLMHKEGKTTAEIREALGLSESTVRSIMKTVTEAEAKRTEMNISE